MLSSSDTAAQDDGVLEQELSAGQVRALAVKGVALIGLRGMAIRLLGFGSNIVLARLLAPEDFGILAFGQAFVVFAGFVADAGMAAGLMSRQEAPDRDDLSAVLGFQLAITTGLAVVVAAVATPFGIVGQVTAIMVAALPFGVLRTPTTILLERGLQYSRLAFAEVIEVVAYVGWSVATVALGAGVWGIATGVVLRGIVGSVVLLYRSPVRGLRPRLRWSRLREVFAFGAQIQVTQLVNLLRSQGLNLATAAIAGLPVLGLWGLVERVMLMPLTLFEGLWRVSFPASVRLAKTGTHPAQDLERAMSIGTIAAGVILVGLAASAPASIPVVFGSKWTDAAGAVPPACVGLLINGPLAAAGVGFLYANGNARRVLLSTVLHTFAWAAVALPLVPTLGATAMGCGWLAASVVDALVIGTALSDAGVRLVRPTLVPTVSALLAGTVGLTYAHSSPPTAATAVAAGAGSLALYLLLLFACHAAALRQAMATGGRALRGLVARS